MSNTFDTSKEEPDGVLDSPTTLIVIWALLGVMFLLIPCCITEHRRKTWRARFRQCKWNVDVGEPEEPLWYRTAVERYERARAAERDQHERPFTSEQEEEIRQIFLLERIGNYTKTLEANDIRVKSEDELATANLEHPIDSQTTEPASSAIPTTFDVETGKKFSSSEESDDVGEEDDVLVGEFQSSDRYVTVTTGDDVREVSGGCAVCLCEYEVGDRICWASNDACPHVFHEDCLLNWLLAVGRKKQKRRRNHPEESTGDRVKDVTAFPMLCPCCRQQYVYENPTLSTDGESESSQGGGEDRSIMEVDSQASQEIRADNV